MKLPTLAMTQLTLITVIEHDREVEVQTSHDVI